MQLSGTISLLILCSFLTLALGNGCFKQASDIVFVLDSSWSIHAHDFQRQISFLRALFDKFTIGQNHFQVGVVSFGSRVELNIKLSDYDNSRDLKQAVGDIRQLEGGTRTYLAIKYVHENMYKPEMGGRPWAKKQMVLITDGLSMDSDATLLQASIARSKGIEVFSIGVGEGMEDLEIRGVASDPKDKHVYRVENYKVLDGIESALTSAACHESSSKMDKNSQAEDGKGNKEDDTVNAACQMNAADVVFLMDSSTSIWRPHFESQIEFIKKVISSFDLGQDAIRVGVVAYSDAPITLLALSDEQSHEYAQQVLSKAPYITGGTDTAFAFSHVRRNVLSSNVARSYVPHIIIILSDGESKDVEKTLAEARQAQEQGVLVFAVGIGDKTKPAELMAMASDPDDKFVLHVNDFQRLSEIQELLAIKTCDVAASPMPQDMPATCPPHSSDVVFVYDTTALRPHHHNQVIQVITEVTEANGLNTENLRVGVMREASGETYPGMHDIELTDQWTKSNFKNKLDPDYKTAAIDVLLRKVRHKYFHATFHYHHQINTRNIVVFLDSALSNPFASRIEALRLQRSHVRILVVTLGKHYIQREAVNLASPPHELYIINSDSKEDYSVKFVVSKLLKMLCS